MSVLQSLSADRSEPEMGDVVNIISSRRGFEKCINLRYSILAAVPKLLNDVFKVVFYLRRPSQSSFNGSIFYLPRTYYKNEGCDGTLNYPGRLGYWKVPKDVTQ